jgi:Na+-transporting methylmalonyl-CoA/oxaloacetate decarboxylase gamma subunit
VEQNLVAVCGIAFAAVFTLLSLLAVVMQLITVVFPERKSIVDPPVVAAISSTVASLVPGARVTRIEEKS